MNKFIHYFYGIHYLARNHIKIVEICKNILLLLTKNNVFYSKWNNLLFHDAFRCFCPEELLITKNDVFYRKLVTLLGNTIGSFLKGWFSRKFIF